MVTLTDIPYRVRNAARMLLRHKSVCTPLLESSPDDQVIKRVTELATGPGLKVNLGCGTDYRGGWHNIDGSNTLLRVDRVLIPGVGSLPNFTPCDKGRR